MRRSLALILILPVLAVAFAGCSDGRKIPTPAACQSAPAKWLAGLTSAPEQVMIEESTLISECFPADQSAAQQEEVGRTTVEVATALSDGIDYEGASINWYRKPDGSTGDSQEHFFAYGRDGQPCLTCGTPLIKIRVVQRGTHFCPNCQRLE